MEVGSHDQVARFLLSSNDFAASKNRVKPRALLPLRGETSVFRVDELRDREVLEIGTREVAEKRGRSILAWGSFVAGAAIDLGLAFVADDTPPRHANVVGWPSDKDERLQKAQLLAAECDLTLAKNVDV